MKQDRQKLEEKLDLILEDYSADNKLIEQVAIELIEKGIPRGRTTGIFTKVTPLIYISDIELCMFIKCLYNYTHDLKIKPDDFFTDIELSYADSYQKEEKEKVKYILLHNVYQMGENQYICPIETYQNIGLFMGNGLLYYNPNTQRQLLKKKHSDKIVESINIIPKKTKEIADSMLDGTFSPNAIIWNIRKINNQEKFKYDHKNRTLLIEPDNISTFVDILDGAHRIGGILRAVEAKPDIDGVTSIYIHHITEERANQIIKQESLSSPVTTELVDYRDSSNPNMEVAKNINSTQKNNEMFNKIALNDKELKIENKLITFNAFSKIIELVYDLRNKPVIEGEKIEKFLIKLFNYAIGVFYDQFKNKLPETKENTYLASKNMFLGYIILGELLKEKYQEDWVIEFSKILNSLDFRKTNQIWKSVGINNKLNSTTFNLMTEYFKKIVSKGEVL